MERIIIVSRRLTYSTFDSTQGGVENEIVRIDATKRFSDRVENYRRFRPGYPPELAAFLVSRFSLGPGSAVADVGSGTGLLSRLFLDAGMSVVGVEPNREMREAGEKLLADHAGFRSVDAAAEATTLPDASVDLIAAGQAFHWFDVEKIRVEWARILRRPGNVALIWNERFDENPFMREVGALIERYAATRDPDGSVREAGKSRLGEFFAPHAFGIEEFANDQTFDYDGLLGRVASSSYLPNEGDRDYGPMARDLRQVFERWQKNGAISFEYRTRVYAACPKAA